MLLLSIIFFRLKLVDMIFGSFPQLILGIFILQGLQIQEPLNILSVFSSFICVIFAFADFLAFNVDEDAPSLVNTLWGMLSTIIDTFFRAFFIAYLLSIVKIYAMIVPTAYLLLVLIGICMKKKKISLDGHDLFRSAISFPCSALEHSDVDYTFR